MTAPPTSSPIATTTTADVAPSTQKRVWALALGTVAVWYLDPALAEVAQLVGGVACSASKSAARGATAELRRKADELRKQVAPLPASALSKVLRRAEAASGAVLDKGARVRDVQTSWDQFLACLRSTARR